MFFTICLLVLLQVVKYQNQPYPDIYPIFLTMPHYQLLDNESVLSELKLTKDQIEFLAVIRQNRQKLLEKCMELKLKDNPDEIRNAVIREALADETIDLTRYQASLESILQKDQLSRLAEIQLLLLGLVAVFHPDHIKEFATTEAQQNRFQKDYDDFKIIGHRVAVASQVDKPNFEKILTEKLEKYLTPRQRRRIKEIPLGNLNINSLRDWAARYSNYSKRRYRQAGMGRRDWRSYGRILDIGIVRDYLKVTKEQEEKIVKLVADRESLNDHLILLYQKVDGREAYKYHRLFDQDMFHLDYDQRIFAILDESQIKRLREIRYQTQGAVEVFNGQVPGIKVSDEQHQQHTRDVMSIFEKIKLHQKLQFELGGPVPLGFDATEEIEQSFFKVLTPQQQQLWLKAIGQPVPEEIKKAAYQFLGNRSLEFEPRPLLKP